ncbi:MAG: DUF6152 family protein [Gammaproteobacteria bacterium]|nr:DUF6152 family protein [Gammaproteobacteria bacterium]MDH4254350.1 DUF6152 family protein [Gammaproteobacteria bacterium]MDH5309367.1 DUF6152 family protein [Gammaproteobacteria bacterium]
MKRIWTTLVCLALAASALPAAAHHSRANFDLDKKVEITGTVTRWQYRNPHGFLWLEVRNATGESEEWAVELGSIPNLKQMGLERDSISVGDTVTVIGNPDRDAANRYVFFNSMTTGDGHRYAFADVFAYSRNAKEAGKAQPGSMDFSGKWDEEVSQQAVLLGEGLPDYPLTARGREVVGRYDPADEPWFRCESAGLPSLIGTPYAIEIAREGDDYRIFFEFPGITRTIHMNVQAHPDELEPSVLGHSIGRIDGDVLIVDTRGFLPTPWGIGQGLDSSEQKHLVEQYRLLEDGHVLEITYTVTDPVFLTGPYSRTHLKRLVPDYELTPYEQCDPEAAGMHLKLEGS